MSDKEVLIIFAKAPEPGQVKTRLQPPLSKEDAARLQEALILDTLHATDFLSRKRVLACAPTTDHPFFLKCSGERPLSLIAQQGKDLGERMRNAFAWGFSQGFRKVVLIGSDAPTLPADFIEKAFKQLDLTRLVLGPSLDGGYYLIGAQPPTPDLFDEIAWGTDGVFLATLRKLNRQRESFHLLPFWYDIDRPQDLLFLREHLESLERQGAPLPKETYQALRSLGADLK
jgi:rSAM/selenodomain-associated transferase 1